MKFLAVTAAAVIGFANSAAAATFGPLVSPQELAEALDQANPIILDIRGDAYSEGHLPGAIAAPYGLFRGPKENPGQILEPELLESRFEALGLNLEQPIVIVHEGNNNSNFGAAARVYWTLKSSGFTDLTILNGGKLAWEQAGLPIDTRPVAPVATDLEITFSGEWTATTPEVAEFVEASDGAVLVDARSSKFYEGNTKHRAAARPGTMPGALNLVHSTFFDEGATAIKPELNAASIKATLGISEGVDVVSFCNTGHWAATNWFAMSEIAGIERVRLYPGSMVEYSNSDLPMINTPGLIKNLKSQLLGGG